MPLNSDLSFQAPDDVYAAILSLSDGVSDSVAHTALAAFAVLLANHIGDDAIIHEAVAHAKRAMSEYPEATMVGTRDPDGKTFKAGGALDSLRKIIEIKPVPTLPGALTS